MAFPFTAPGLKTFDFSDHQVSNPGDVPGTDLDAQFDKHSDALIELSQAMTDVRRSDGALKNAIVTRDSLDATLEAVLGPSIDAYLALEPSPSLFAAAELWADVSRHWAEYTDGPIPGNILAEMGIVGDHWSARWWANRALALVGFWEQLYLGPRSSNPTAGSVGPSGIAAPSPLRVGSIYYDTTDERMKVWTGAAWIDMSPPVSGGQKSYWYVASGGQTAFTGADNFGNSLLTNLSPQPLVRVLVNGVSLMPDGGLVAGDFTVNHATNTVTLGQAAAASDVVEIQVALMVA